MQANVCLLFATLFGLAAGKAMPRSVQTVVHPFFVTTGVTWAVVAALGFVTRRGFVEVLRLYAEGAGASL